MELWYRLIDLLPFQWTGYAFMKNALLAVLLSTPVFGLLGTMIVNNKMAFFSDALGHSALAGIGIGVAMGISNPDFSMVLFALVFAIGIVTVKHCQKSAMDSTIGVFSSTAVALGVVLLSKGGFNKYSNIFVGDILSITPREIFMLVILLVVVITVWSLIYNVLFLSSLGGTLAKSRGINILAVDMIFTALIALVVSFSVKWLGLLIINSLFVLPPSAARLVAGNMKKYTVISVLISVTSGILGLLTSFYLDSSAGATIAIFCSIFYGLMFIFSRKR